MKTSRLLGMGLLAMTLGTNLVAASVVVISPLVHMDTASGEIALCMALNVSETTLDATLQLFNSIGQPQGTAHTVAALPSRHMIDIEPGLAVLNDSFATCQLTSTAGKKGDFLMTLCVIGGPHTIVVSQR
jgi:hypothetical protein